MGRGDRSLQEGVQVTEGAGDGALRVCRIDVGSRAARGGRHPTVCSLRIASARQCRPFAALDVFSPGVGVGGLGHPDRLLSLW